MLNSDKVKSKTTKVFKIIGMAIGGLAIAVLLGFVFGIVVKALWNWIMPEVFGLSEITFWQAFGIVILAKILFGSIGHHSDDKHKDSHHHYDHGKSFFGNGDFFKKCMEDEWKPRGSYKNWKHYEKYWHDQGKEHFEHYLDNLESANTDDLPPKNGNI